MRSDDGDQHVKMLSEMLLDIVMLRERNKALGDVLE